MVEHLGEDVGNLQIIVLGGAGGSHPHSIGVSLDDGDDSITTQDGNGTDVHRDTSGDLVVTRLAHVDAHVGLGDQGFVVIGRELAHDVGLQRGWPGVWTHLRSCPEHGGVIGGEPENEV